jgi:hypothetical protein
MAVDRYGRLVDDGDTVRFAEIDLETTVTAVADAGIYVSSAELGTRYIASSDRCFEVTGAADGGGPPTSRA